jgi:hypothetical protein
MSVKQVARLSTDYTALYLRVQNSIISSAVIFKGVWKTFLSWVEFELNSNKILKFWVKF